MIRHTVSFWFRGSLYRIFLFKLRPATPPNVVPNNVDYN